MSCKRLCMHCSICRIVVKGIKLFAQSGFNLRLELVIRAVEIRQHSLDLVDILLDIFYNKFRQQRN